MSKAMTKFTSLFVSNSGEIENFAEMIDMLGTSFSLLDDAIQAAEDAGGGLTGLFAGIGTIIKAHPIATAITGGVALVTTGISLYNKYLDEAVEKADEAAKEWNENNVPLQDNIDKIRDLRTALDNGKLSEEEAYTAKSNLLDIQQQLTESYGKQVEGINLVNGELETQIGLLNQINQTEAQRNLNENKAGIEEAKKQMSKNISNQASGLWELGTFNNIPDAVDAMNDILEKYGEYFETDSDGIETRVYFKGNAEDAQSVLNDFMTDVDKAQTQLFNKDAFEWILSGASEGLSESNKIIDKYKNTVETAKAWELAADTDLYSYGNKKQTAVDWLRDYTSSIEEYNKALASGDEIKIAYQSEQFQALDEAIKSLLSNSSMSEFASDFEVVGQKLDTASISAREFKDALQGINLTDQTKENIYKYAQSFKNRNIDDKDFLAGVLNPDDNNALGSEIVGMNWMAGQYGVSTEDLINMLVELQIISGETAVRVESDAESIAKSFETMVSDETDNGLATKVSAYTDKMAKLTAAKNNLNKTGGKLDTSDLRDLLKDVPELSDYMDDLEGGVDSLITASNNDALSYFADQVQALRDAGMDADASALEAYAESVIDAANEIEGAFIKIGGLKVSTPDIAAWEDPGEYAGSTYEKILAGYEAAKEAYENDEVGTKAFKAFGKMISPTGSDDAASFGENMEKFERYFTEGSEGCLNFLNDLKALNLAEENNGKWTYKLGNSMDELKATAEQLGIGFEPMMAIFGRLEDYGFHNDFFTTEEDGAKRISELYDDLAAEKMHLAELEANPNTEGYDTAIQASKDKIAEYEERIQQCNQILDEMAANAPEELAKRTAYAKSVVQDLQEQIASTDNEQLKTSLQQQLDEFAKEHKLIIDVETGDVTSLDEAISNIEGIDIDLNANGEELESEVNLLSGKLEELRKGDPLNLDTTQIESVQTILSYLIKQKQELNAPAVMRVSTEQMDGANADLRNAVQLIQDYQTAWNAYDQARLLGVDTSEVDEAKKKVDEARTALENMPQDTSISFNVEGLNDAEILEQIANLDLSEFEGINKLSYEFNITNKEILDEVVNKIKELPEDTKTVSLQINTTNFSKDELQNLCDTISNFGTLAPECSIVINGVDAETNIQTVQNMLGILDDSDANPSITADNSDAESKIDSTTSGLKSIPDAEPTITVQDNASPTISNVKEDLLAIDGTTVTTHVNTVHHDVGKGAVHGNAHANGTPKIKSAKFNDGYVGTLHARATGSWGEKQDTDALTGELGRELIVRNNRFFTVGDNGPEMVHLKKGDIVFNHKQTVELLSKGHTTGRGKALVEGNARVGGGTLGGNKYTSSNSSKSSSDSSSSSGKSSSDKKKKDKKEIDKMDWIEVAIDRIERKINKLKNTADNIYRTFKTRNAKLKKEIAAVTSEIDIQRKGYKRYLKEANSVKLDSKLKKKVQNGTIDINQYSEDTQKQISLYQKWYEKAISCKDAISELKITLSELHRQEFDNIVTKWTNAVQNLEHEAERTDNLISRRNDYASDYVTPDNRETAARKNISSYQSLIQNAQQRIADKNAELIELQNSLNEKISNSAETGIYEGSEGYYEMLAEIQSVESEIDGLNSDIIGYSNSISEAYMNIFDNIATGYENKLDLAGHLAAEYNNALEMAEAKGYIATGEYYKMLKEVTSDNIATLQQEQKSLSDALYESLASGEIQQGSQAWYDMTKQINDVTEAIQEAEIEMQEFNNSIREANWEQFDYLEERISRVCDEADFFIDLMDSAELFDEKGKFTNEGMTTLGMHGQNYNTLMKQADDYANEVKKVNEELANDPYNTEIIARKEELIDLQRQSILAAQDEKEAIRDLVREGIEKELSYLKDLIDNYNEALDSQKDLYDYQKRVSEQAKNIASLQKQLSAYQGDTSEETKAKIQKLKVDLESAKDDLEETQYDKYISDQKELLDDLYDDYEKALNERLDNLDALVAEMIDSANRNANTINNTLIQESQKVGYAMTQTMTDIWGQASAAMSSQAEQNITALTTYSDNFSAAATTTNAALKNISDYVDALKKKAEEEAAIAKANAEAEAAAKMAAEQAAIAASNGGTKPAAATAADMATVIDDTSPDDTPVTPTSNSIVDALANALSGGNIQDTGSHGVAVDKSSSKKKKLKVGDKVTYKSGEYYNSSDGSAPTGHKNRGKKVYITKINSGAQKPYHISTGKKLGNGDLGWLTKSQLNYAKGAKNILKDQMAWTNENWKNGGAETIVRKSDGAILTPLPKDSRIYNAMASKNMWQAANNPAEFIRQNSDGFGVRVGSVPASHGSTQINMGDSNFSITLPNVKNYDEFKAAMQKDKTFEKFIQSITIDPIMGKSRNGKNRFNF